MSAVVRGIKLVVAGDEISEVPGKNSGYAKTALLLTYINNRYPEDYIPTVFDNYVMNLTAGEENIELGLWDTSGQFQYDRLRPLTYANANVFIILFSVVNPISYENVSAIWVPELMHFCPGVPIILAGCQIELRDDEKMLEKLEKQGQKPIMQEKGRWLAKKIKAVKYIECSARTGENVKTLFHEAVKAVLFGTKSGAEKDILDHIVSDQMMFNKEKGSKTLRIQRKGRDLITNHTKDVRLGSTTKKIKLVVIGDSSTDKTTFLISYAANGYPKEYIPTVFDNYVMNIVIGQDTIELGLWDTHGQEEYDRTRPLSYAGTNIFLVLFSVMNPVSYESISAKWIPELIHFCPNVPAVLVGCKTELRDDQEILDKLKKQGLGPITYEQGYMLSKRVGIMRYMECSAKSGEGLKQVFNAAVEIALKKPREQKKYRKFHMGSMDNEFRRHLATKYIVRRSLVHRKRTLSPPPRSYLLSEKHPNRKSTWSLEAFLELQQNSEASMQIEEKEDFESVRPLPQRVPLASQQSDFRKEIDIFLAFEDKRDNLKEWSDLLTGISHHASGLSLSAWQRLEKQYYIAFLSNDSLDIFWVVDIQNTFNILLKSPELNPLLEQWTRRLLDNLQLKMQRSLREDKWADPTYPVKRIWKDIAHFLKHKLSLELDRFSPKDTLSAELIEWCISIAELLGETDVSAILMCKAIALSSQDAKENRQKIMSLYALADKILSQMMLSWQPDMSTPPLLSSKKEDGALMLAETIEGIKGSLQAARGALRARTDEGVLSRQVEIMALKERSLDNLLNGLQRLWQASLERMEFAPPCAYTLVLLGSYARRDHTLYSDLEFLLVIGPYEGAEKEFAEKLEGGKIESYFRQCFELLLLHISLLGEEQDKNHILGDIPYRLGIHIDDIFLPFKGCECLFGTVKELAEKFYLDDKSLEIAWPQYIDAVRNKEILQGKKDRYSLIAAAASYDACFFYGDEDLFTHYVQERQKVLSAGTGLESYSSQAVLGLSFFREATLSKFMREGELFQEIQVKARFLSVVIGVIKALSMYHGLNKKGLSLMATRERCQQLVFAGIIDKSLGVCLEVAYDFCNRFRDLSYCEHDNQYDYWLLFGDKPQVSAKRLWQYYPQMWKEAIVVLHEIIYPLHNAFADWMDAAQLSFERIRPFSLTPEVLERFRKTLANEGKDIVCRFEEAVYEILTHNMAGKGTFLPRLSQRWWQFLLVALLHLSPRERAALWLKILPQFSLPEREQFLEAWDTLMQRPLNLEQEHGYFSPAEIKKLREEIATEFARVAPHLIFEDGWTILAYRKQQQWQEAVNGLFSGPFSVETNDLADTVVHKKQVVVGCLDPKLNAKEIRKRLQRSEAISSLFVLSPEVQAALERDEERAFTEARKDPSGKRHIVLFFENKIGDEIHHFCLKLFPENPGMEYFITQLQYTLGGDELPNVWLWRIYTPFYPDGIAALLMEDVRGLRYTPEDKIAMLNLSQVREKNPGILFALDEDSFARHFLRVTLTTPEDDKPNDYYVIPGNRKDAALRGRYILHRVDNERSLYVSELFEHKLSLLGQSAYSPEKIDRVLKLKTVIYCMENMGVSLSVAVLRTFVQLDMKQTFKRWLEQIEIWNASARQLFKFKGIMSSIVPSASFSSATLCPGNEPFEVSRMHYQGNFYRHGVFHFAPNPLHVKEIENFCLTVMPVPINKFMEMYLLLEQMKLFFKEAIKITVMPTGLETLKAIRPDQYKHYHDNLNPGIRIGIKETDIRRLSEGVFRRFDQATEGGYNRGGESSQVYRSMVTSGLGELMRAEDYDAVLQGSLSGKETATADTVESLVFTLERYELSGGWTDEVQMIQRILLDRFWDILAAPLTEPNSRFSFFIADDPVRKRLNQILTEFNNLSYYNKLELRRYFFGGRKKKTERNVAAFHPEVKKYVLSLLLNEPIQAQDPPLRRLDISGLKEILTEKDLLKLFQKHGKTLEKVIIATQFNPYGVRGFKECVESCPSLAYMELSITEDKISSRVSLSLECRSSQLQTLILSGFVNLESLIIRAPKLRHLTLRGLLNLKLMDITLEKLQFMDICYCPRLYSHVFQDAIMGRLGLDQKMPVIKLENNRQIKKSFLMKLIDEMLWQEPDMASKITLAAQFTLRQWRALELLFNQECNAIQYKIQLEPSLEEDLDLKQLYSNSHYRDDFARVLIIAIKFLAKAYPVLESVTIQLNRGPRADLGKALRQVGDPKINLRIFYNNTLLYNPIKMEIESAADLKLPVMRK